MNNFHSLDALVRARLQCWPQSPPGAASRDTVSNHWLRGRPGAISENPHPFLKFPGSSHLRTLPDGLWLHFGGTPGEPFVDIFAIEACGSLQNLLDKRSRFAPSTHSLLAVCPLPWLLAPASASETTARWELTGVIRRTPTNPLVLPVRDVRVMYGLKQRHYDGFIKTQIPHPHEYFVPMGALVAEDAVHNPAMQALVSRASANANFLGA
ncbi:MAG: hypothetical protein ACREE5_01495 [Acetobacteraceae bacterium]